jgi:hypothetical protein
MEPQSSAEEDLRVIRSLMERATVYRAVSAPSALVAGLLSLLTAGAVYINNEVHPVIGRAVRPREFVVAWLAVFTLSLLTNVYFLWREAKTSGRPFISSGMKLALRTILPTLFIPALFTIWFLKRGYLGAQELQLVGVWVAFYGLALLSTGLFAPRSLYLLGWANLAVSLFIPILGDVIDDITDDAPDAIMGLTFGVFHVIYAILTWRRGSVPSETIATSE